MNCFKKILAVVIALSLLLFTNSYSLAANRDRCENAPDKIHHYDGHRNLGSGYSVPAGQHQHLDYFVNGIAIYYDCELLQTYYYCENYCIYCNATLSGSTHVESGNIVHHRIN